MGILYLLYLAIFAITSPYIPTIRGGHNAATGEVPYFAHIDDHGRDLGGTLISPEWVLTAAHNVDYLSSPDGVGIYIGGVVSTMLEDGEIYRPALEILVHPDYSRAEFNADIALIRIDPIDESETIKYAEIYSGTLGTGDILEIAGYGALHTDLDGGSTFLQIGEIVVDQGRAWCFYRENFLCSDIVLSEIACQGDSGGPATNNNLLVGVITATVGTGFCGSSTIVTKLSPYVPWIESYLSIERSRIYMPVLY